MKSPVTISVREPAAPLNRSGLRRMSYEEERPILSYLKSLPIREKYYFFPNPGNAGDSLIAHATYRLFTKLGLDYTILDLHDEFDPVGKTMIYGGGGNLVQYYSLARDVIEKYHPYVKKLIILPHTISANEDLLCAFRPNVDIICREPVSYEHVRRNAPKAQVLLMDDLALSLEPRKVISDFPHDVDGTIRRLMVRDIRTSTVIRVRNAFEALRNPSEWATLNAFRTDVEATQSPPVPSRVDLASVFAYGTSSEKLAHYVSRQLFKTLTHYRMVRTDRLHVCIAAALLGMNVEFYPNSYFKCEAVYSYSLKHRFPNVKWMGA